MFARLKHQAILEEQRLADRKAQLAAEKEEILKKRKEEEEREKAQADALAAQMKADADAKALEK